MKSSDAKGSEILRWGSLEISLAVSVPAKAKPSGPGSATQLSAKEADPYQPAS